MDTPLFPYLSKDTQSISIQTSGTGHYADKSQSSEQLLTILTSGVMHARWATGRRLSNYKYTAHTGPPIVLTALHNL